MKKKRIKGRLLCENYQYIWRLSYFPLEITECLYWTITTRHDILLSGSVTVSSSKDAKDSRFFFWYSAHNTKLFRCSTNLSIFSNY